MKKTTRIKKYVHDHKTPIVAGTIITLTGIVVLQHSGIKSLNAFLDERGLLEEYYAENED